jgi:hypothetical protein
MKTNSTMISKDQRSGAQTNKIDVKTPQNKKHEESKRGKPVRPDYLLRLL